MKRNLYLVWFALAAVNLVFAASGRGSLHYLIAALFLIAGILGRRRQSEG